MKLVDVGLSPLSGNSESRFRNLLAPVGEAVGAACTLDQLNDLFSELERVRSQAEARRLSLVLGQTDRFDPDDIFDVKGLAGYLRKSVDWVHHNKRLLSPALVSPPNSRPQYSKKEIDKLRRRWAQRR